MRYTHTSKEVVERDLRQAEAIAEQESVKIEQKKSESEEKIIAVDFGRDRLA